MGKNDSAEAGRVAVLSKALDRFIGDLPRFLYIESTNACNLRCPMCPTGRGDLNVPLGHMKPDVFAKILNDSKGLKPAEILFLHKDGEPLLNPNIVELVRMGVESGIAERVAFATNGMLLDKRLSKEIVQAGIGEIYISIESLDPKRYSEIRRGGDLAKTLENIRNFIEIKGGKGKGPGLVVTTINMGCSAPDVMRIFDEMGEIADRVQVVERYGWAGRYNEDLPRNSKTRRHPCPAPWYLSAISWKGKATLCCLDAGTSMEIGDVVEDGVLGVWRGAKYAELRKKHLRGAFNEIPLCAGCVDGDVPWIEKALDEIKK